MYFTTLMEKLPSEHKAKWLAGAALNSADQSMMSVMSTALSRLNSFLDSEMEQILCFGTAIDAEVLKNTGVTTHKLRHTAATLMYNNNGGDILAVKEILGHESTATTEIYTHLGSEKMKNTMDVMEDLLKKKD